MLAARSVFTSGAGWQPDPRASLGLAVGAAALLCLAFLGLLYRPAAGNRPALLTLSVIHSPAAKQRAPRANPELLAPTMALPPVLTPMPPLPGPIFMQEQIDQVVRESVVGSQRGPFLPPVPSELSRALQAPEKPGTLKEGESYRTNYGDAIVKSGSGCTSLQQLEIGPVAKAQIGFMVVCPGERKPTMADALSQWADKRAQATAPPRD